MSLFKRKPKPPSAWEEAKEAAKSLETPSRETLRDMARDIAARGWDAPYPGVGYSLLLAGELQRQIDELKGQIK